MLKNIMMELFDINNLIFIALIIIISIIVIRILLYSLDRFVERTNNDLTAINFLKNIIQILVIAIAITLILSLFGINITAIVFSFGIIGVSLGFAGRDILANFLGGIFILADDSIKIGETVTIDDQTGEVLNLGLRTTTLITPDNKIIKVPNMIFSKKSYTNCNKWHNRRIDIKVSLPYVIDIDELNNHLISLSDKYTWTIKNKKPQITIEELTDTGVTVIISVWTEEITKTVEHQTQLAKDVKKLINEVQIKNTDEIGNE